MRRSRSAGAVGLKLATDGEFRRPSYQSYFFEQLGDLSIIRRRSKELWGSA